MKPGSACWFVLVLVFFCPLAYPQTYPAKPVRLVIGSFPGGGIDLAGRIIAQKMSENLGQQVVVDNRGGANGIIGMETVARAAPDGYTLYILPGVPTLSETLPGVVVVNWYGAILPRGTPKEIVGRLHAGLIGAMNTPDVRARLAANGFDANGMPPEQFGAFRKAEEARWGRVIKQAGLRQQ